MLDRNYVFTDPAGDVIRICYCPIRQPASQLSLFSLGYERLEELLADPFFDGVISEDEKQTLVYSVRQNDEAMYLECCQKIESEDPEDAALRFLYLWRLQGSGCVRNGSGRDLRR